MISLRLCQLKANGAKKPADFPHKKLEKNMVRKIFLGITKIIVVHLDLYPSKTNDELGETEK